MQAEARIERDLPERFARLYDYRTNTFATPLDSRGIADADAILELALRTYPDELPDFSRRMDDDDAHHIYWSEAWWRAYADRHEEAERNIIYDFRNGTPQKMFVPRVIHSWIETVMQPAPPPAIDVMKQRNEAWESAKILLKSAFDLDKARKNYNENKHGTRIVYGCFEGLTPVSARGDFDVEVRMNREYWLSKLNEQLAGWRYIADSAQEEIPQEYRFIPDPRLFSVRALSSRIKGGGFIPAVPPEFAAA